MMKDVFAISDNIISPLGCTTKDNFGQLSNGVTGILQHPASSNFSSRPFYASLIKKEQEEKWFANLYNAERYTRFEKLLMLSVSNALLNAAIEISDPQTVLIISSTKGNIGLLETESVGAELKDRISLHASAKKIANHFQNNNVPVVISNACISGLTALLTGKRLIESGQYKHAVVAGADLISAFILSGFQSFQAISEQPCKPFDKDRDGINLGEAAATIILSCNKNAGNQQIKLMGGAVSNDANHISGPSRSGLELCIAITKALKQSNLSAAGIDFISAHGTATVYNDEMEAKAFSLAGLETIPVNSLKGFYGHTLGAAGIVESVIAIQSLKNDMMIPTIGFRETGVSKPINVCNNLVKLPATHCLKTASGFGGCNAALVFGKAS
jgi:3-oxoacyl-[acyl-carrier-protein] synthase I